MAVQCTLPDEPLPTIRVREKTASTTTNAAPEMQVNHIPIRRLRVTRINVMPLKGGHDPSTAAHEMPAAKADRQVPSAGAPGNS